MRYFKKSSSLIHTTVILTLFPMMTGFVLLSKNKATLDVTPESPQRIFVWDGKAPSITSKEKYRDGLFENLEDQEFMERLLADAMDVWNRVPGAFVVLQATRSDSPLTADNKDGVFAIITDSSSNSTTAAYAKPQPKEDNPSILWDCDISLSDRDTTANDLVYTIAHELGHCLGLGHDHTNYGALMGYSRGSRSLKLGADDIAGVTFLYPDPAQSPSNKQKELICGTISGRPDASEKGLFLILFPLLTLLGAILTRRLLSPLLHSKWFFRYKSGNQEKGRLSQSIESVRKT